MTLDQTLGLIASRATTLARVYPSSAAELQRERRLLQDVREDVRTGYLTEADLATARHGYRSRQVVCEECRGLVHELADLVAAHLPDLYPKLRKVKRLVNERWHDVDDFDWGPVVSDLETIEAEARHRGSTSVRLTVNPDGSAVLDGKSYPLRPNAARCLQHLIDARGSVTTAAKMKVDHSSKERPDKAIQSLPKPIRSLILSSAGKGGGYRLSEAAFAPLRARSRPKSARRSHSRK